ncbi:MAG: sigma-54 dependent transcriptional regulator [Candidatus Kapabacteria bacterium]|nr:sigma-54 dependent transcriptional regulator [Candidatus Kapabacteria bacterium]
MSRQTSYDRHSARSLGIVGSSVKMQEVVERLYHVAPTDLCVLLTGESGTGKEVFARAIHRLSKRNKERLISINCAAIPETLLESELFGSEKGAYTGAVEQRKGFFEAADKGTIFLDEVGEMPVSTQVKLLRVLETGEFSRLGSPDILKTDVRVIAATNRRLEEDVASGTFRTDLFYRLNSVRIEIPPLREHAEDIPELVEYFAQRTAAKNNIVYEGIHEDALDILVRLPWTGNIRELRNLVETVVTLEQGRMITVESLRPYLPRALKQPSVGIESYDVAMSAAQDDVRNYEQAARSAVFALPPASESVSNNQELPLHTAAYSPALSLLPLTGRIPEQLERELIYKALVDLAREVTLLRGEIAEIKDMLVLQSQKQTPDGSEGIMQEFSERSRIDNDEKFIMTMSEVEKRLIGAALHRFSGNRRQAAHALGISERTLYRKLHEYGFLKAEGSPRDAETT